MAWYDLASEYMRVNTTFPCPVCGKHDGCLVHKSGKRIVCYHVQSTRMWKIGFLHRLNNEQARILRQSMVSPQKEVARVKPNFEILQRLYSTTITQTQIQDCASRLGVTAKSLIELGIGWSNSHKTWTFPVRDERYQIVGIQTRSHNGNKRMIKGSAVGVFSTTEELIVKSNVFITEGLSDTAAALSIGLGAIGRFNAVSCQRELSLLLDGCTVFIIADNSGPEIRGAVELRDSLRKVTKYTGVIVLPFNVKDLRAALNKFGYMNTLNILWTQVQEQLDERASRTTNSD